MAVLNLERLFAAAKKRMEVTGQGPKFTVEAGGSAHSGGFQIIAVDGITVGRAPAEEKDCHKLIATVKAKCNLIKPAPPAEPDGPDPVPGDGVKPSG